MSEHSFNQPEVEISLKDIIDFLLKSWKIIIGIGLLGLLGSLGFLIVAPNNYEATAQIQMAQISVNNTTTNPLGVNVEDPSLLMARLKLPTNYSSAEIKACSLEGQKISAESLLENSKFSIVKGAGSLLELKIRMESKEQAVICAQLLFENILNSQKKTIKPHIDEANYLLDIYNKQLKIAETTNSRGYLVLMDEKIRLTNFIASAESRVAKLAAPIYVAENPVFPKKMLTLMIGFLMGLFLGTLITIVKKTVGN